MEAVREKLPVFAERVVSIWLKVCRVFQVGVTRVGTEARIDVVYVCSTRVHVCVHESWGGEKTTFSGQKRVEDHYVLLMGKSKYSW